MYGEDRGPLQAFRVNGLYECPVASFFEHFPRCGRPNGGYVYLKT